MDLPQAVAECAGLLNTAGSALKRIVQSEVTHHPTEPVGRYLDEVLQIAKRLEQLSEAMIAASDAGNPQIGDGH